MIMRLRVEYAYDSESRNWSFRVPSLGIVGGADTRDDAERKAVEPSPSLSRETTMPHWRKPKSVI
jgi:hypothetical protein